MKGPVTRTAVITHNMANKMTIDEPGEATPAEINKKIEGIIAEYREKMQGRTYHHLGYPYNLDFDYGPLECLQKYSINNLGAQSGSKVSLFFLKM